MVLLKKKPNYDFKIIDRLVRAYLDYLKRTGEEFTCSEISEIFRYSMCYAQGLDTNGYSERVERIGVGATNVLHNVLLEENLLEKPVDVKHGLLEACVYSMESARNRVLGVVAQ